MNLFKNSSRLMLSLAVVLGLSLVSAARAADTGTVSGKITGKDDKAVAGVKVGLMKASDVKESHRKKDAPAAADKPAKGEKPKPVAEAKSESDGTFTMKNVPTGDYVIQAMAKGQGRAREKVSVKSGETANVTLKLSDEKPTKKEGKKAEK